MTVFEFVGMLAFAWATGWGAGLVVASFYKFSEKI